jgi:hypothetical protein
MATNFNPYQIIPETTAFKIMEVLGIASAMAKESYPHLAGMVDGAIKTYTDTALSFIGSENIPASARKAFGSAAFPDAEARPVTKAETR